MVASRSTCEQLYYNSTYALQENKFGLGVELEGAEMMTLKEMGNWLDRAVDKVLAFTDINDATVPVTHFIRGGNAINMDRSQA